MGGRNWVQDEIDRHWVESRATTRSPTPGGGCYRRAIDGNWQRATPSGAQASYRAAVPRRQVEAALDLLHLMDMAWHDCYGPQELEVPPAVLDDVLLLAEGDLALCIRVALDAVRDFRDVRVAADEKRATNT